MLVQIYIFITEDVFSGGGVALECIIVKCVSNVLKLQTNAQFDSDRQVHAAPCFLVV